MESDTFTGDFMSELVWKLSQDSMENDAFLQRFRGQVSM